MPKYKMTLSLHVLDHLGFNLYSNIPAVLSEIVANAWDADASVVDIQLDNVAQRITITDNGLGMSQEEINDKFLTIGYRRREAGEVTTPSGRHVMGRKGIGKLSLFAIADMVRVTSIKRSKKSNPPEKNAFIMKTEDIKKAAAERKDYLPKPLPPGLIKGKPGTKIILTDLKTKITTSTETALRKRLARRFSIIGKEHKFSIKVNDTPIGVEDRDYFNKIQYLWSIGQTGTRYEVLCTKAVRREKLSGVVNADLGYQASGWIGTFDEQRSIDEGNNTVSILAWGKLIQEDILKDVKVGGLFTKYLIGEIRADFLDLDDKPDIATSDRQSVKEDDPRYDLLLSWVKDAVLREIENRWRDWRRETALDTALENEAVTEWYRTLSTDNRRFAKQLFGKIGTLAFAEPSATRELYKHAIMAFEKLRFKESLSKLESMPENMDFTMLQNVFDGIDELEAVEYHRIAKGRLEVIQAFSGIVEKEKERVIQRYLFDHLWLLHPSWERASTNARIEESVKKEFSKIKLSNEEKRGRIDIRYTTAANKHVIIELKRYDVRINLFDLAKQLNKYRTALDKCLREKFPEQRQPIEMIAILGQQPQDLDDQASEQMLRSLNARVILYDTLIQESLDAYRDYISAHERISRLNVLLDRL